MNVIKLGMIGGSGQHATENLLPVIAMCKSVVLSSVCSRDLSAAKIIAHEWGAKNYATSWQEVINDKDVDAVVVSSTPEVHEKVATASLQSNKYVYVEKPPAETLHNLEQLINKENSSSAKVFVGFNFDYGSSYRQLREAVKKKGKIQVARVRFVAKRPTEKMWACQSIVESFLYAVAIHAIDLVVRLFGCSVNIKIYPQD